MEEPPLKAAYLEQCITMKSDRYIEKKMIDKKYYELLNSIVVWVMGLRGYLTDKGARLATPWWNGCDL